MKLILAVVNKPDAKAVVSEMMKNGFGITKLSSYGGFLRGGSSITLMCVTYAERVEQALDILKATCKSRKYAVSRVEPFNRPILEGNPDDIKTVVVGGANVFVLNVEDVYKF